jgi:methionyl-tRNA synthetase
VDKLEKTFALTTPLYYVNDLPHMGSAYPTIAADVIARFQRLLGHRVLLITGTDEHGLKIQRAAESKGLKPQEYCDGIVPSFVSLWELLNIQYDRFIRTTDPRHEAIVKEFFQRVWDQGDIYQGQQKGWYCVSCEEFKEERDLLEGHRCPIHTNKEVEWRDEQNYFFRLSKYQSQLQDYTNQTRILFNQKAVVMKSSTLSNLGMQDLSISRVNLAGVFLYQLTDHQTLYVWFDAAPGLCHRLMRPTHLENASKMDASTCLFNGKDNLRFQQLLARNVMSAIATSSKSIWHGFLTKESENGENLGNTLDPVACYTLVRCSSLLLP